MATKAEGIWGCTVLSGKAGEDRGVTTVQINVQIDEGPSKGQRATYEESVDMRSAKYVTWTCNAVGWKGKTLKTLEADIEEWINKTGGKTTVEIRHLATKRGKAFDKWVEEGSKGSPPVWDKVSGLGRGMARALKPASATALADADEAMRSVSGEMPPEDDVPHAAGGNTDDIPFGSCDLSHEPSPIAKVLR